jgi:hypothetical protein
MRDVAEADGAAFLRRTSAGAASAASLNSHAGGPFGSLFRKKVNRGCTDKEAMNFNKEATQDDGSCVFLTPRDPMDDGRYKFYRSDMDDQSPLFVDPEVRRLWRNTHFNRGMMTVDDVEMTTQQKVLYGLASRGGATATGQVSSTSTASSGSNGEGGGGGESPGVGAGAGAGAGAGVGGSEDASDDAGPRLVFPVGEPIPQSLDDKLDSIELQDARRKGGGGGGVGDSASSPDSSGVAGGRETLVPMTVMGVPADIWPNPVNVPVYHTVAV